MLRSNFEKGSTRWAVRRAQWIAMGIPEEDFMKPKIAVVNSSSTLSVCYIHLDEVSRTVQKAIRAAGGLPFEIRTAAPSDFVTSAGLKARYLMPTRDLVVNDIEVMVEGACLDGMVLLSSCDKTTPAHLMAAARLNVPSIVVPCGYQLGGQCGGHDVDIEEVYKAVGTVATGHMSVDDLECWTKVAIQGPGVCAGLATANSMHVMAEALGMALSGTTPIRAGSDRLHEVAGRAGATIMDLVANDLRPRQILTAAALRNAVRVAISIGASVNVVRHLTAIATEGELGLDVVGLFEDLGKELKQITQIKPNGPDRIETFDAAGGTRAVQYQLRDKLETEVLTVTGKPLGELLREPIKIDEAVIRPMNQSVSCGAGIGHSARESCPPWRYHENLCGAGGDAKVLRAGTDLRRRRRCDSRIRCREDPVRGCCRTPYDGPVWWSRHGVRVQLYGGAGGGGTGRSGRGGDRRRTVGTQSRYYGWAGHAGSGAGRAAGRDSRRRDDSSRHRRAPD